MEPNFDPPRERLRGSGGYDLLEESARVVTEGVWYADRADRGHEIIDISNGIWWTHSGSHIVSLAHGTGLHARGEYDYETFVFHGSPNDTDGDICCHESFDAAEACALGFIRSGHFCRDEVNEVAS